VSQNISLRKMNREELIQLVKRISAAEGTEKEIDALIRLFENNVPDPNAIDYIFQKEYEGLTVEEIVDKALSNKPFRL
jgi:hypothetical protein